MMDTNAFGGASLRAQAKITRKDGTVEVVDVTDEVLAENPGLMERLLAQFKREKE